MSDRDEEGCCLSCGADAVGDGADLAIAALRAMAPRGAALSAIMAARIMATRGALVLSGRANKSEGDPTPEEVLVEANAVRRALGRVGPVFTVCEAADALGKLVAEYRSALTAAKGGES